MGARGVVGTVVVLGLVGGGVLVTDRVLHTRTEEQLATELRTEIPGLDADPDVTIEGFPFLTQVLAGELDKVTVTAPGATVGGLHLEDITVDLGAVSTDQPHTAGTARMTAWTSLESIEEILDLPVALTIEGEHLVAATELLGLPVEIALLPRAAGREVEVGVDSVRLGAATVSIADLPGPFANQLDGLTFPVDGLPEGLELTEVTLDADGARLVADGTDVVLDASGLDQEDPDE